MKNIFFSFLFLLVTASINAQSTPTKEANLLTSFVNSIKPSSFNPTWLTAKTQWLDKALKIAGGQGLAKSLVSLSGFLKPSMFKSGFNLKSLQQTAGTVKSLAEGASLFKKIEEGIKPEAMMDGWKDQRGSWLNDLNQLK